MFTYSQCTLVPVSLCCTHTFQTCSILYACSCYAAYGYIQHQYAAQPVGGGGFEGSEPPQFSFYTMPGYTCTVKTFGLLQPYFGHLSCITVCTLQKHIGCFNHRVVTLVADKLKRQWLREVCLHC